MRKQFCILFLLIALALAGCNQNMSQIVTEQKEFTKQESNSGHWSYKLKYNLNAPDFICALDKNLMEVSALSFDAKSSSLFAVNDEKAIIYRLDGRDCSIDKEFDFGKKGDYEGIEIIGDDVYVLKANGNIYRTTMQANEITQEYKTPLSATNDVEGLGYNPISNELILACKGSPMMEGQEKLKATKAFYSFDLGKKKLKKEPCFTITDKALFSFYEKMPAKNKSHSSDKKLKERLKSFSPSAIAWHPIEKIYYVLSSVGKLLVLVDKKENIKSVTFLDDDVHGQPEGICFAPNGTMYVSNEGRGLVAKIMKFDYLK